MQTLLHGPGSLAELPKYVSGKVLIVTDAGIVSAGHVARATALLNEVTIYDAASENPTESDVGACAEFARSVNPDVIIGLGGGSSMDTAKGTLFLLSGGGTMSDYHGHGKAKGKMLPFIAIPTTAGTGSECQSYAVLSRDGSHEKMACGDSRALAKTVILDPELTASMPLGVARLTALDALSHALESAVCTKSTPESRALSFAAFRKFEPVIEAILTDQATTEQRGEMLHGAALAGQAIEASMLGAAHATANPLTAHFDVVHGRAVLTMLPTIMRWNSEVVGDVYNELKSGLIQWVESLRVIAELEPITVSREMIPQLAAEAAKQWTGQFNPRPFGESDYVAIYHDAL
ncbi:iron-containing alcohol dehydrogenase [bacterium]|nr:iron-containing alcohol dehydrogenase [Akkermansiaceae bacterium]MDB4587965.1 iron-containing alcohol dehydrogenase [bacterium]MDB4429531.1 iron-containing alcohol dehydrogenase [Akkermansiaceae bacterium]MDB4504448.1 iron-containing alcohol dehydrogenase [Akkermansiaceae bacterium]MDB4547036.1 iron-containing alcohol dehydrogenase [Akkermansiaceae bacterium]